MRRCLRGGGFEHLAEAVAELGDGVAEGEEAVGEDRAGEVERVASRVEVAIEGCRLPSAEWQRDGQEIEADRVGGARASIWAAAAAGLGSGRL